MLEGTGDFPVRAILRTILAVVLLLGSGVGVWTPVLAQASTHAHEACCCGTPVGGEDRCPCPKPDGNRSPSQSLCQNRTSSVVSVSIRRTQGERRTEPRPEPATWAKALDVRVLSGSSAHVGGRDPDLGRHLARLNTLLI